MAMMVLARISIDSRTSTSRLISFPQSLLMLRFLVSSLHLNKKYRQTSPMQSSRVHVSWAVLRCLRSDVCPSRSHLTYVLPDIGSAQVSPDSMFEGCSTHRRLTHCECVFRTSDESRSVAQILMMRTSPLMSIFNDKEHAKIAQTATVRRIMKSDLLIAQGKPSPFMYIVLSGMFEILVDFSGSNDVSKVRLWLWIQLSGLWLMNKRWTPSVPMLVDWTPSHPHAGGVRSVEVASQALNKHSNRTVWVLWSPGWPPTRPVCVTGAKINLASLPVIFVVGTISSRFCFEIRFLHWFQNSIPQLDFKIPCPDSNLRFQFWFHNSSPRFVFKNRFQISIPNFDSKIQKCRDDA